MRRALLIGVRRYSEGYSEGIADAVEGDVASMRRLLNSVGFTIWRELGEGRTPVGLNEIRNHVRALLADAADEDDVLIYYSGHGLQVHGVAYLVPSEAAAGVRRPEEYCYELRSDLGLETSARSVTVVVDACRIVPEGADPGIFTGEAAGERPVAFIFAAAPGEPARTLADGTASTFTRALVDSAAGLAPGVRIAEAEEALARRMSEIHADMGLPPAAPVVVCNVPKSTAPYPVFAAEPDAFERDDRWTRLLDEEGAQWDGIPEPLRARLLACLDRLEATAPDLDEVTPWADRGLPARLAKACITCGVPRALDGRLELPLFLVLVALLEAEMRHVEADAQPSAAEARRQAVLAGAPELARVLERSGDDAVGPIRWVSHLAAFTRTVRARARLRERIDTGLADLGILPSPARRTPVAECLVDVAVRAFDDSRSLREMDEVVEVDPEEAVVIRPRRLAALLELVWRFALDTRLLDPEGGLQLALEPQRAIAAVNDVVWVTQERVVSLSLQCPSAALDNALRDHVESLTERLVRHTQPNESLYGEGTIPLAVTASRLLPHGRSYTLPHIIFRPSSAETQALLRSATLYGSGRAAIRELYQNAVDACRYRQARLQIEGRELLAGWRPQIRFDVDQDRRTVDCTDNGIGMGHHELREAFAKGGRRFRDLPEYQEESAAWEAANVSFEPISEFGIGVLSYFLISERIELWTMRLRADGGFMEPIYVDIEGPTGVFRVQPAKVGDIEHGGTRVRLHLREDAGSDVLGDLEAVVHAPLIDVSLHDGDRSRTWDAGLLYAEDGILVEPCLPVPAAGVYFHRSTGRLLVNGIGGRNEPWTQLSGVTVSLDRRSGARLTIDRTRLLDFDENIVVERIVAAADAVGTWDGATCNWLLELFHSVPEAARTAMRRLAARPIEIEAETVAETPVSLRYTDPDDVVPERRGGVRPASAAWERLLIDRQGLHVEDTLLPSKDEPVSRLGRARRMLLQESGEESRRTGASPFPKFDDKLIHLLAAPADGWENEVPERLGARLRFGSDERGAKSWLRFVNSRDAPFFARLTTSLDVSLGAAATFAWAVAALEIPNRIMLRASAAHLVRRTSPDLWALLREAGDLELMTRSLDPSGPLLRLVAEARVEDARSLMAILPVEEPAAEALIARGTPLTTTEAILLSRDLDGIAPFEATWERVCTSVGRLRAPRSHGNFLRSRSAEVTPEELDTAVVTLAVIFGADPSSIPEMAAGDEGGASDSQADAAPRSDQPPPGLSSEARLAASVDLDRVAPFFTEFVPALHLARAAAELAGDPLDLGAELGRAGLEVRPDDIDLVALTDVLRRVGGPVDAHGRIIPPQGVAESVKAIADLLTGVSWTDLETARRELEALGVGADDNLALCDLAGMDAGDLRRDADALPEDDAFGPAELVHFARTQSLSLDQAHRRAQRYRRLVTDWTVPDELPSKARGLVPHEAHDLFFEAEAWPNPVAADEDGQLSGRAIRTAAWLRMSVTEAVDIVEPLLSDETGRRLRGATSGLPTRAPTFDDLLVLGTQQFVPPIQDPASAFALCRPFSDSSDGALRACVDEWLQVSHAGTD